MWIYEKKLEYPVKIARPNAALAKVIITQFGGPDGELGASQRYLSQRYSAPYEVTKGILTDIGTEELAHVEMICAIVHQLTRDLTMEEIKKVDLIPILWIIPPACGRRPRREPPGARRPSSPKAILLPTCTRIWLPSKKREQRMTTFCAWQTIRTCGMSSNSCGSGKWCTIRGSVKPCAMCRTIWTAKTTTLTTRSLTNVPGDQKSRHTKRKRSHAASFLLYITKLKWEKEFLAIP